jgi:OOP family OmpA-OmpF porin
MKKIILGFMAVLALMIVAVGHAEIRPGATSVTPFIGGYIFEGNQDLKSGPAYGIRAGYHFTQNWGLEAYFHYVTTEIESLAGNPDVDLFGYGVEALYHFMPEGRLVPFLAAGVGGARYDVSGGLGDRNKFTVDYGAGLKFFLTDSIALRADVRHVMPFNDRYNDLLFTVGINFLFGGEKKKVVAETRAAAEVVLDSDRDGVPDNLDKCPDTPLSWVVDKDGCPIDSDGDGVHDYLDKCPGTPAGVKVDNKGCPPDLDGDGVPDYLDKCPGTPAGVKVDKDGCPLDSDGDGVPDYLDKCPGTPAGVKVDKDGCPMAALVQPKAAPVAATPMEKAIQEKGRVTLKVLFDFDKAVVKNQYHNEVGNLAEVMKKQPELKILIEGHTDSVGDAKYNEQLSQRRADAIRKYLVEKFGIDGSRLTAKGFGESRPVASNDTKDGRDKNRRVEAAAEYIIKKK